jgi:hypothetical protein
MQDTSLMGKADIVVLHYDGNNNDPDDHSAIVIGSLLTRAAGHQSKTHVFFGNNVAEPNNKAMLANIRDAADYAEQFGLTTHDYQAGVSRTTAELVALLNSGKKVLMIEGGPMEAAYRAMEQVSAANRDNITFVSHSTWNETRAKNLLKLNQAPRDWEDLKRDFPDATFIDISNQNDNFKSPGWSWLDNKSDSIFHLPGADDILGDGREIMEDAGKIAGHARNDPSDAGMVVYALTGRQNYTPAEAKQYLIENWGNISGEGQEPQPGPQPGPQPAPQPAPGNLSFDLAILYDSGELIDGDLTDGEVLALDDLDDGPVTMVATPSGKVGSVKLDLVGVNQQVENTAPYALFGDDGGEFYPGRTLDAGDYEIVLTAYSGSGGGGSVLGSDTISFSIAAEPDPGQVTFDLALAHDDGRTIDGDLTDGEVVALDDIDDGPVTLIATPSAGVGSVRMELVGVYEAVENAAPYVLFGDKDGEFYPGRMLGAGDYEIVLTAYSGSGGGGSVLGSDTISFSVAEPEPTSAATEDASLLDLG